MYNNSLQHHGILGQKWGVRRYQNEDGSLTNAGKSRYSGTAGKVANKLKNYNAKKATDSIKKDGYNRNDGVSKRRGVSKDGYDETINNKMKEKKSTSKKVANAVARTTSAYFQLKTASLLDDVFLRGAGKQAIKTGASVVGKMAATAVKNVVNKKKRRKWYTAHWICYYRCLIFCN